jgi:hypothetical protein
VIDKASVAKSETTSVYAVDSDAQRPELRFPAQEERGGPHMSNFAVREEEKEEENEENQFSGSNQPTTMMA